MGTTTAIARRSPTVWGSIPFAHFLQELEARTVREVDMQTGVTWCSDPGLEIVAFGVQLLMRKVIESMHEPFGRVSIATYALPVDRLLNLGLLLTYPTVTQALAGFERDVLQPIRAAAAKLRGAATFESLTTVPSAKFFAALYKRAREYCEHVDRLYATLERMRMEDSEKRSIRVIGEYSSSCTCNARVLLNPRASAIASVGSPTMSFRRISEEARDIAREIDLWRELRRLPFKPAALGGSFDLKTRTVETDVVATQIVLALAHAPTDKEVAGMADLEAAGQQFLSDEFDVVAATAMFMGRMRARGWSNSTQRGERLLHSHVQQTCLDLVRICRTHGGALLYDKVFFDMHSMKEVDIGEQTFEGIDLHLNPETFLDDLGVASYPAATKFVHSLSTAERTKWLERHVRPHISFREDTEASAFQFLRSTNQVYYQAVLRWLEEDLGLRRFAGLCKRLLYQPTSDEPRDDVPGTLVKYVLSHTAYEVELKDVDLYFTSCPRSRVLALLGRFFTGVQEWNKETRIRVVRVLYRLTQEEGCRFWVEPQYRMQFVNGVMSAYGDVHKEEAAEAWETIRGWMGAAEWIRGMVAYAILVDVQSLPHCLEETTYDTEIHPLVIAECEDAFQVFFAGEHWLSSILRKYLRDMYEKSVADWCSVNTEEGVFLWMYAQEADAAKLWLERLEMKRRVATHLRSLRRQKKRSPS